MKIYKTTIVFIILNILLITGIVLILFPLKKNIINSNSKLAYALYSSEDIWSETVKISKVSYTSELGELKEEKLF